MTTELKNVEALTDAFLTEMTAQGSTLADQLKTLDSDYKTSRANLVAQIASVDRVVKALRAKATTQPTMTFRKPMSEAGRQNIANALRARRERLAAEAVQGTATEAAAPSGATEEQSAATEVAAEPDEVAEQPTVKTTALERDVLVGGILQNNFQDGANGEQAIWSNQIIDNGACKIVTAKQLPGVITSLVKKGLAVTDGEAVKLTVLGLRIAREAADVRG